MDQYDSVFLTQFRHTHNFNQRYNTNTIRTHVFEVQLRSEGSHLFEIKEFTDYKKAEDLLHTLADKLELPTINEYQLKLQNTPSRPTRRRRRRRRR